MFNIIIIIKNKIAALQHILGNLLVIKAFVISRINPRYVVAKKNLFIICIKFAREISGRIKKCENGAFMKKKIQFLRKNST